MEFAALELVSPTILVSARITHDRARRGYAQQIEGYLKKHHFVQAELDCQPGVYAPRLHLTLDNGEQYLVQVTGGLRDLLRGIGLSR